MSASHLYSPPRSRSGFTLIEILVVISIIAILAALITPAYFGVRRNAFELTIAHDLAQLDGAVEKFKDEFGFYPPDFSEFVRLDGTALAIDDVIPQTGGVTVKQRWLQYLAKISPTHSEEDGNGEPTDISETRLEHWWHVVGQKLATDTSITPATKEARLRGPQYALWFWLSQLHNDAQYPLTGQRLGLTPADSDGDGIQDWADFVSQRKVFYDFEGEQLEQVFTVNYPEESGSGNSVFIVLRPIQRSGDGPVTYFHHDTYIESVSKDPSASTFIDFFPGSAVPNFSRPVREPGSDFYDPKFFNPTSFQIIASGWDESFGNIDSLVQSELYPTFDNLANFTKGRLDAFIDNLQNP